MIIGDCKHCGKTSTYIDETGACPNCFDEAFAEQAEKEAIVKCSCGSEILMMEYDEEIQSYYVSMYDSFGGFGLKQKLRHIWQIIRHGTPYSDYMVLDKKSANKLAKFIDKQK